MSQKIAIDKNYFVFLHDEHEYVMFQRRLLEMLDIKKKSKDDKIRIEKLRESIEQARNIMNESKAKINFF
jgi:hypothetical protein